MSCQCQTHGQLNISCFTKCFRGGREYGFQVSEVCQTTGGPVRRSLLVLWCRNFRMHAKYAGVSGSWCTTCKHIVSTILHTLPLAVLLLSIFDTQHIKYLHRSSTISYLALWHSDASQERCMVSLPWSMTLHILMGRARCCTSTTRHSVLPLF